MKRRFTPYLAPFPISGLDFANEGRFTKDTVKNKSLFAGSPVGWRETVFVAQGSVVKQSE